MFCSAVCVCLKCVYKPTALSVHAVGDGGVGEWTLGQLHFPRSLTVGETLPLTVDLLLLSSQASRFKHVLTKTDHYTLYIPAIFKSVDKRLTHERGFRLGWEVEISYLQGETGEYLSPLTNSCLCCMHSCLFYPLIRSLNCLCRSNCFATVFTWNSFFLAQTKHNTQLRPFTKLFYKWPHNHSPFILYDFIRTENHPARLVLLTNHSQSDVKCKITDPQPCCLIIYHTSYRLLRSPTFPLEYWCSPPTAWNLYFLTLWCCNSLGIDLFQCADILYACQGWRGDLQVLLHHHFPQ